MVLGEKSNKRTKSHFVKKSEIFCSNLIPFHNNQHQGKGYFSKLFKFVIEDLKNKGYTKCTLGVEPKEIKNLQIYRYFGFNTLIKSGQLTYPDGTIIDVDYYEMELD